MASGSLGHQARFSAAAVGTAVGSYVEALELITDGLKGQGSIVGTGGLRGTRSHASERTRFGINTVGGPIVAAMSPAMLDLWLPRILGGAESVDSFPLAETLPEFDALAERIAKRFVYGGCKVARCVIRGQAGANPIITMTMDIIGKTFAVSATAFPAIAIPVDPPYVFSDAVLTLAGSARNMMDFELTIDNAGSSRHTNSRDATDIQAHDRIITLRVTLPYTSDETDLYAQTLLGAAGTLVFTNGGYSTTFSFAKLQVPDEDPTVQGKGEIPLVLTMTARKASTTTELATTHDSVA